MAERTTMVCPHCDGTGKGPQSGHWGALLTAYGHLPAECQNCLGAGVIEVYGPAASSAASGDLKDDAPSRADHVTDAPLTERKK